MILTDNETKVDLLNNEAIAATIIGLLRAKPDHPMTIEVHGDWGAGKSSVLEMIEAGFADKNNVLYLKFNGWRDNACQNCLYTWRVIQIVAGRRGQLVCT